MKRFLILLILTRLSLAAATAADQETVNIGLNYPQTGPYATQGKFQRMAAELAVAEINRKGGILNRTVRLLPMNTGSDPETAIRNVKQLIDIDGCEMIFGGSSSAVAIASGKTAASRGKLFFGTLTYSNETTGRHANKYMFRECNSAWMSAKTLSAYLNNEYKNKKFFYISANYTWGRTTEDSLRKFTNTTDRGRHKGTFVPFPGATISDFRKALILASAFEPDVLVLVLFGNDMVKALTLAKTLKLKDKMVIVVPNITLGMASDAGPEVMEGIVGTVPWCWQVPFLKTFEKGERFVNTFSGKYNSYPSSSAASAYTIVHQYKSAVERARTFKLKPVVKALEGHSFTSLKDTQVWREFDHQCVQTVYVVRCKAREEVSKDKFKQDFFEIISSLPGNDSVRTRSEWLRQRKKYGQPLELQW